MAEVPTRSLLELHNVSHSLVHAATGAPLPEVMRDHVNDLLRNLVVRPRHFTHDCTTDALVRRPHKGRHVGGMDRCTILLTFNLLCVLLRHWS